MGKRRSVGGTEMWRALNTASKAGRKAKIYPDFIFAVQRDGEAKRITILETKGDQLDNLDTAYKRETLAFLSDHFKWDDTKPVGELELINDGEVVQGRWCSSANGRQNCPLICESHNHLVISIPTKEYDQHYNLDKPSPQPYDLAIGAKAMTNLLENPIFQDETKAREWVEAQVWANGVVCPSLWQR